MKIMLTSHFVCITHSRVSYRLQNQVRDTLETSETLAATPETLGMPETSGTLPDNSSQSKGSINDPIFEFEREAGGAGKRLIEDLRRPVPNPNIILTLNIIFTLTLLLTLAIIPTVTLTLKRG